MYERYAALFALRNLGQDQSVSTIVESLGAHSALLRHEVCLYFLVPVYRRIFQCMDLLPGKEIK